MSKMLIVEPITNLEFEYNGSFLGLIGNLQAYRKKQRFIKQDLNRSFTKENIEYVESQKEEDLEDEFLEIKQILQIIRSTIEEIKQIARQHIVMRIIAA